MLISKLFFCSETRNHGIGRWLQVLQLNNVLNVHRRLQLLSWLSRVNYIEHFKLDHDPNPYHHGKLNRFIILKVRHQDFIWRSIYLWRWIEEWVHNTRTWQAATIAKTDYILTENFYPSIRKWNILLTTKLVFKACFDLVTITLCSSASLDN